MTVLDDISAEIEAKKKNAQCGTALIINGDLLKKIRQDYFISDILLILEGVEVFIDVKKEGWSVENWEYT